MADHSKQQPKRRLQLGLKLIDWSFWTTRGRTMVGVIHETVLEATLPVLQRPPPRLQLGLKLINWSFWTTRGRTMVGVIHETVPEATLPVLQRPPPRLNSTPLAPSNCSPSTSSSPIPTA